MYNFIHIIVLQNIILINENHLCPPHQIISCQRINMSALYELTCESLYARRIECKRGKKEPDWPFSAIGRQISAETFCIFARVARIDCVNWHRFVHAPGLCVIFTRAAPGTRRIVETLFNRSRTGKSNLPDCFVVPANDFPSKERLFLDALSYDTFNIDGVVDFVRRNGMPPFQGCEWILNGVTSSEIRAIIFNR